MPQWFLLHSHDGCQQGKTPGVKFFPFWKKKAPLPYSESRCLQTSKTPACLEWNSEPSYHDSPLLKINRSPLTPSTMTGSWEKALPSIFCPVVWEGVTTQLLTFIGMTSPRPAYSFSFLFFPGMTRVATGSLKIQPGLSDLQHTEGSWRAEIKWVVRATAERFVCSGNA